MSIISKSVVNTLFDKYVIMKFITIKLNDKINLRFYKKHFDKNLSNRWLIIDKRSGRNYCEVVDKDELRDLIRNYKFSEITILANPDNNYGYVSRIVESPNGSCLAEDVLFKDSRRNIKGVTNCRMDNEIINPFIGRHIKKR